jgi:hypothetical protein
MRLTCRLLACLSLISIGACRDFGKSTPANRPRAKFGVFFGTQLQQRQHIPLVSNVQTQRQGFRIEFPTPLPRAALVEWELDFPTKRLGPYGPSNAPRALRSNRANLPAGTEHFEQTLDFLPTDVTGTWNVRIRVDRQIVLDRAFLVVPVGHSGTTD